MRLEGEIYRVITREPLRVTVDFLPQSGIYAAHFPGHPITPGAVLVRMAAEMLSGARISGARDIRFLSPVPPDATGVTFAFEPLGTEGWSVQISCGETVYAIMRLTV